jgi:hypothetical protein
MEQFLTERDGLWLMTYADVVLIRGRSVRAIEEVVTKII